MRVLITGAGGQLGSDLMQVFDAPMGLTHAELDIADRAAVHAAVAEVRPDVVVNAAAWTDVDGCERAPERAHGVNALGPWWLAQACRDQEAALVTFSSDYVFDGTVPDRMAVAGWTEMARVGPVNEYGHSKLAGEHLVRETLARHCIVRTSWVCGATGKNFIRTMLKIGRERGAIRVVDDQVGSPTFARDLAASVSELVSAELFGTFHRTNTGYCSWFDLAELTLALAGIPVELTRQSSEELSRQADRPKYSVLSNLHAECSGLRRMPTWQEGLARLLAELGEDVGD